MKNFVLLTLITCLSAGLFAQSSLKVYSLLKSESSHVKLFLNDIQQDSEYAAEAEITDLALGTYELRVTFNADSIADVIEQVVVAPHTAIVFRVEEKTAMGKEMGTLGRSMGRVFGTVKDDEEEGLVEHYKIVKVSETKTK